MKEMMKKILENIKGQVTFADIRITKTDTESYMIQRGSLKSISADYNDTNAGIRVLVNGCWGFAGTDRLTPASLETAAKQAIAKESSVILLSDEKSNASNIVAEAMTIINALNKDKISSTGAIS